MYKQLTTLFCTVFVGIGTSLAMAPVSNNELNSVVGMDWTCYSCCNAYSGSTCTWTPPEGYTGQCFHEEHTGSCDPPRGGNNCYKVDNGPNKHDSCQGSGNPSDICELKSDGPCVQYRTGTCKQVVLQGKPECPCDDLGTPQYAPQRTYCRTGSTPC